MERSEITTAKEKVRAFLNRRDKRRERLHDDTLEKNVQKLRALEGICGSCKHIIINIHPRGRKDFIGVACRKGNSPVELYVNHPIGTTPNCSDREGV